MDLTLGQLSHSRLAPLLCLHLWTHSRQALLLRPAAAQTFLQQIGLATGQLMGMEASLELQEATAVLLTWPLRYLQT